MIGAVVVVYRVDGIARIRGDGEGDGLACNSVRKAGGYGAVLDARINGHGICRGQSGFAVVRDNTVADSVREEHRQDRLVVSKGAAVGEGAGEIVGCNAHARPSRQQSAHGDKFARIQIYVVGQIVVHVGVACHGGPAAYGEDAVV